MCLSNREKDAKREELMALACYGDVSAQLPGIFTYFRPDKDKKIIIRAKNIYRYNYPKIMQKVCESIFILFHSEAAPKQEYSRVLNSLLNAFENNPISERIANQAHALVHDFGVMYSSFNKGDNFADQGFKAKEAQLPQEEERATPTPLPAEVVKEKKEEEAKAAAVLMKIAQSFKGKAVKREEEDWGQKLPIFGTPFDPSQENRFRFSV